MVILCLFSISLSITQEKMVTLVSRVMREIPSTLRFLRYHNSPPVPPLVSLRRGKYLNPDGDLKFKLCTDASYEPRDGKKAYGGVLSLVEDQNHMALWKCGARIYDPDKNPRFFEYIGIVKSCNNLKNDYPLTRGVLVCNDCDAAIKHMTGEHRVQKWVAHSIDKQRIRLERVMPLNRYERRPRDYPEMDEPHQLAQHFRKKK